MNLIHSHVEFLGLSLTLLRNWTWWEHPSLHPQLLWFVKQHRSTAQCPATTTALQSILELPNKNHPEMSNMSFVRSVLITSTFFKVWKKRKLHWKKINLHSVFWFFFSEQAEKLEAFLLFGDSDRRESNCSNEWNTIPGTLRDNSSETELPIIQNRRLSLFESETQMNNMYLIFSCTWESITGCKVLVSTHDNKKVNALVNEFSKKGNN